MFSKIKANLDVVLVPGVFLVAVAVIIWGVLGSIGVFGGL